LKAYEDSELDVKYKEIDIQDLCQRITNVSIKLKIIKNHTYMIYLYCIINKKFYFFFIIFNIKAGLGEALIEKNEDDYTIIKLPVYHAFLKFNNRSILIETVNNKIRKKIYDIIKDIFDLNIDEIEKVTPTN